MRSIPRPSPFAPAHVVVAATVLALAFAGCGADVPGRGAGSEARPSPGRAAPTRKQLPAVNASTPVPAASAAARLARATRQSGGTHRSFTMQLDVRDTGGATPIALLPGGVRARVSGVRAAGGPSIGTVTWSGAAVIPLRSFDIAIADNRLLATADDGSWRSLGSASGIDLDLAREAFAHPFLLEVTAGSIDHRNVLTVRGRVPARRLARYAATERDGLASTALARATGMTFVASIVGSRLQADRFSFRADGLTVTGRTIHRPATPRQLRRLREIPTMTAQLPVTTLARVARR